ncbi:Uncharacterized protein BP5553_01251 [Venustampulla echinocandica]|uniref:non-specific serine/threonine protein kinase n=1 Tax=Venustampulla echinocandica TaxID=2656787 RepID=A0A370U0G3_9HELO|nr:Uncharacterized protein BP5553_01251 [Venustampulla echinocandica]RDL41272.1 Uncharacterized protein BP5553_01251 [Venustampulla echinocandica]
MDYRRTSLAINTQPTAGINTNPHIPSIFPAAGTNRHINEILSESPIMWWDEERIEATVTRQFVLANLRPDEQVRLDEPLGFGDGLTNDTYMEWIDLKAKRIFLILVDLDVPDQIFGVIDDSWDDDDLPIPLDQVERLRLTYERDERLEKRFFQRQFLYLLRNIQKGEQVYYDDEEVVPLEMAEKRPIGVVAGLTHSYADKVHLPWKPDDIFLRRGIPLGEPPGRMRREEFLSGIEDMKTLKHGHLISLWASYIHQDYGYLLLTPINDSSLKSFLTVTPQSFKILAKQDRRILLLNWLHCLADALSFLHSNGLSHGNIRPSNVMLDPDNHIFLGDSGILPITTFTSKKRGFDQEIYCYSAPEQAPRPPAPAIIHLPSSRPTSRGLPPRRMTAPPYSGALSVSTSIDAASIHTSSTRSNSPCSPTRPGSSGTRYDPQKADIFSLGAIFLEILTFLLKRASRSFASHRSSKNRTPGRGGGLPDSSFHKNLGQVESWMKMLAKDAAKKEDGVFRGVSPILKLVDSMIRLNPDDRPSAQAVQRQLYLILSETCRLGKPSPGGSSGGIHCEAWNRGDNGWIFGMDELRVASQRAAAAACANLAPINTLSGDIEANAAVIYGVEKISLASTPPLLKGRSYEGDSTNLAMKTSTSSEETNRYANGSLKVGVKVKPKARPWQAPVYAGSFFYETYFATPIHLLTHVMIEFSFGF